MGVSGLTCYDLRESYPQVGERIARYRSELHKVNGIDDITLDESTVSCSLLTRHGSLV